MLRKILLAAVLTLAAAPAATAATAAVAVTNVNLRAGPSTVYPTVTVVPTGAAITTFGCVATYSWCDIGFGAYRGWMAASYIQVIYGGAPVVLTPPLAPTIGITVVVFNRAYWDRYYVAYPWYRRWAAYPPYAPPRVTSVHGAATCAGGACVGVRGATGVYGGATAQTRVCSDGACSSARITQGPHGGTAARTRSCAAGQGCTTNRTVVGPGGGVHTGTRSVQR